MFLPPPQIIHLVLPPPRPIQIEGEFPELLPIKESLIKYVFEPNAAKVRRGHRMQCAKRASFSATVFCAAMFCASRLAFGALLQQLPANQRLHSLFLPLLDSQKDEVLAAVREMRGR